MCDLLYNGNASEAASLYNASSFSIAFTSTKKTKQNKKENSKMYKQSTNQHHTENKMQIWKIVEEKSQCESKFQKSKIKNQKIKKSQREWKKDLWQRIGFHRQESWEGTIWQSRSSACRSALFLQCPPFLSLSLSLSLFWECGRFWKGIEFAVCVCLCVFVVEGRKRIRIWSGPLVWFGGVCVMREMDGRDCLGPTEVSNQTHVVWDL